MRAATVARRAGRRLAARAPGAEGPGAEGVQTAAPSQRIVVIGRGRLIDVVRRSLEDVGTQVIHLGAPSDREIRRALSADVNGAVIICRDDRVALRLALVVAGVRPGVRLVVTVYDRDLGDQLRRAVADARVMSMADIVAPALAGPCIDEQLIAVSRSNAGPRAVRAGADGPVLVALSSRGTRWAERVRSNAAALLHPFELSAQTLLKQDRRRHKHVALTRRQTQTHTLKHDLRVGQNRPHGETPTS